MTTVQIVVIVLVVALVVAVAVAAELARRRGQEGLRPRRQPLPDAPAPTVAPGAERATVTLPVDDVDPSLPSVERLVHQAAEGVFGSHPQVQHVEVRSRTGTLLGEVDRPEPGDLREVALPEHLREPRPKRHHTPSPVGQPEVHHPGRVEDPGEVPTVHRTLLERFELPPAVEGRLHDDADLVDLLAALLIAGGHDVEASDDLVKVGDTALVVLDGSGAEAMNHAYRRYDASGAQHGLAIALGFLSPDEVRRRETLAPDLRYVGPEAVQRMADAVAVGADPLAFALGTPSAG
jgi:hypothetical protein